MKTKVFKFVYAEPHPILSKDMKSERRAKSQTKKECKPDKPRFLPACPVHIPPVKQLTFRK
ncbi:hypothetical protein [Bacteroides sp. CAG:633]|uniref:hypothetical protein n=1 Tax=Bacteroides sp. CAG:633 TaxID=1262744 RepID=UPI00258EEAEB|nr:hypothetical protein [Bacteroides sp. CAG:633]